MSFRSLAIKRRLARRWRVPLLSLSVLFMICLSVTTSVLGQSTSNLGVGSGGGAEVGLNLAVFNQLKADVAAGVYDRQCTPAEHDPTKWHTMVNIEAKCHYDHHHGDDPSYVSDIFGDPGAWFGRPGQSISYPWQTFRATSMTEQNDAFVTNKQMENDLKHEGYTWVVRRNQPCPNGACTTDFRLLVHSIFGAHDAPVRWHSFSYEGRVCQNAADASTCGIVRHGGWIDFGRLFVTAPDNIDCGHAVNALYIPLPADTQYFPLDRVEARDEVRCHTTMVDLLPQPTNQKIAEWWGLQNGRFRVQVRSHDPIGNISQEQPDKWSFYCTLEDVNCRYDQTVTSAFIGYVYQVPEFADYCEFGCLPVDPDRNGKTNFTGFTNRFGRMVQGCTGASLDCVPIEYNNVTLNFFGNKEARYSHSPCDECDRFDHDLSPVGKKWNTWFFTKYGNGGGGHSTDPTPVPTTVPTIEAPSGAAVIVDVAPPTANPGETVNVTFNLSNVEHLYGLQAQCMVDPGILTGTTRTDGDAFNPGNSFIIDNGFQPDGTWTVAASRLQPAEPISGSTTAFTLAYTVQNVGEDNLMCSVMAVDENGNELSIEVINGQLTTNPTPMPTVEPVTVEPTTDPEPSMTLQPSNFSTVSGTVAYQNRPDNGGILVRLISPINGQLGEVMTDAAGTFIFNDVITGEYKLLVTAPQHIPFLGDISVAADGTAVDAGSVSLQSGDTDNNGTVDILDATFVGANFGVDTPPAPGEVDLNGDTKINITDLVLVGSNVGVTSPLPAQ